MSAETALITASLRKLGLAAPDEEPQYEALAGGVSSEIWCADLSTGPVCVKRALPRLRVEQEWLAPVERNGYEVAWFRTVSGILPGAVPRVLGDDPRHQLFVMEYLPPESYPTWKERLRAECADAAFAAQVGSCLGLIHSKTARRPDIAAAFPTDAIFHRIRLEPYLEAAARAHPDLATMLMRLVTTTAAVKYVLVHGDVSPKNILCGPQGPVFLDAECAWFGDPAFDLAFCLNHLLLKCLLTPTAASGFLRCFEKMRDAYMIHVHWEPREELEARTAALLPGLFLARVDGKSPVEYLTAAGKNRVRWVARDLLQDPPQRLEAIRQRWMRELGIA